MMNIQAFTKKWDMLPPGGLILCAVSGGRDSMALLHLLWEMGRKGGFQVHAAHFNHHLRPTADRDQGFVTGWCGAKGIPLTCGGADAAAYAREVGTSLEDGARQLRYRFLEETADRVGAARIATAHHREDNAETLLLHLLRGSGLRGLGGIPPVRGRIVRPLLETSRADIDGYVRRHQISYMEDETNADTRFTRNRLRLEVFPLLEEISPGCTGRMAATADLLREDDEHFRGAVDASLFTFKGDRAEISLRELKKLDQSMARRTVREMSRSLLTDLGRENVDQALALGPGGYLDLPGRLCAYRTGTKLTLRREPNPPLPLLLTEGTQVWWKWLVQVYLSGEPVEEDGQTVALGGCSAPLTIALWNGQGSLAVENGQRTIKRLFTDRRIPIQDRWEHPALYVDGRPAAVFGVATDWTLRPRPGESCLVVKIEEYRVMTRLRPGGGL